MLNHHFGWFLLQTNCSKRLNIAWIARILTISEPTRSRRHDSFSQKTSNEQMNARTKRRKTFRIFLCFFAFWQVTFARGCNSVSTFLRSQTWRKRHDSSKAQNEEWSVYEKKSHKK